MHYTHKIAMVIIAIVLLVALAGAGKMLGENTLKGSVPNWVCYVGTALCVFGFGFFDGLFKP